VLSDAAAWVAFGSEGRVQYRKLRIEAGRQVESFEDESYYDCFHDALDRSKAVDEMHTRIREACHKEDTVTPLVLELVQTHMLVGDWKKRLASRELFEHFRQGERRKRFMAMANSKVEDVKASVERVAKGLSNSVPIRDRQTNVETQKQDDQAESFDAPNTPDLDDTKRPPRPPAIKTGRGLSNLFRQSKGDEQEQEEGVTTLVNDGPVTSDTKEEHLYPALLPPIKLSASPTLPPRRPGPHPHIPNDTSNQSPLSDGRNSFSEPRNSPTDGFLSPMSDISSLLSPPADTDHERFIARPPSPTHSVEDIPLDELNLTLEEAQRWRDIWKNYDQLPPDKHRIIKSIRHSLRGRDHIFFVDDSRTMKQHAAEVEAAFETLAYIVKPQEAKDRGNVSLALNPSPVGKGKQQRCFYTDNSKTTNLVNILKKSCTYERIETMIEDVFSDFIDREIIPRLPLLNPHREGINSLPESGKPASSKRSSSASRTRAGSQSAQNTNPISIIVLTNGQWGDGDSGAGVDNPIWRLIEQLKERELKRTQVMVQFVRFGDGQDGVRHLEYLAKLGRGDSDGHTPG